MMVPFWILFCLFSLSLSFCLSDTSLCMNEYVSSFSVPTSFSKSFFACNAGALGMKQIHFWIAVDLCQVHFHDRYCNLFWRLMTATCFFLGVLVQSSCLILRAFFSANNDNGTFPSKKYISSTRSVFFVSFCCLQQFRKWHDGAKVNTGNSVSLYGTQRNRRCSI